MAASSCLLLPGGNTAVRTGAVHPTMAPVGIHPATGALRLLCCFPWDSELEAAGEFGCGVGKGLEQMRAVWRLRELHKSTGSPRARGDSQLPSAYGSKRAGGGPAAPDCFSLQLPWKPPGRRFYFPGAAVPSAACQLGRWMVGLRGSQERTADRQIQKCETVPELPASGSGARPALL